MKVRLSPQIYIRHVNDESIVVSLRTGGSIVMRDVLPFLDEIKNEWRNERDIVVSIAEKFDCDVSVVMEDFCDFIDELSAIGFIEREGSKERLDTDEEGSRLIAEIPHDGLNSPIDDFYIRNCIPSELHIDLTDACTEKCVHCYVPQNQHDFLPYEHIEKLLKEFRASHGLTVHLTGGEAMLHPDFERICRLCVELNINIIVFSNLTLCNEKRIAFLREVDPQFINVSLYSMNADEHDAITCLPGSWQKTMDAILACEEAKVHIRLATPLLNANRNAYPDLKEFADEHHMHLVPACDIVPRANHTCTNLEHACSAEEMERVVGDNRDLFDRGWTGEMPSVDARVCDIGNIRIYVNAKGEYYPCDCMHDYVLGNIYENTLLEIWRGEKMKYLRGLRNRDFGRCMSCIHRPYCKVCPAFNFNATGDLLKTIPEKCRVSEAIHRVYGRK